MPVLDFDDEFTTSGGQAVTADAIGTKYKNAGAAKDWGAGEIVCPYIRTGHDAAPNPTTSETVDIVGADNAALTTNPVVLSTLTIAVADLAVDKLFQMPPLKAGVLKQYLGCRFVNAGGAPTQGKWTVGLIDKSARPQNVASVL